LITSDAPAAAYAITCTMLEVEEIEMPVDS
jgi:hypothetical protein